VALGSDEDAVDGGGVSGDLARPYPLEKDVRETKLITRTVNDTRVNANLSFLRLMFLFAMEKMGITIFLTGRCPSPPLAFIRRGKMTADESDTIIDATPTPTYDSKETMVLPGNVRNSAMRAETAKKTLPRAFTAILFARMNATIVEETVRKTIRVNTESEASRTIEERRSWA
jgi:hypothetical protein